MPGPRCVLILGLLLALPACGNRFSSGGGAAPVNTDVPTLPPPTDLASTAAGFRGAGQVTPLLDGFQLDWDPVQDAGAASLDFAYEVYLATGTAPLDYTTPLLTTAPAAATATVTGLAVGTSYQVAVRAVSSVDPLDVDRNSVVLAGVVARHWYVDRAAPPGGDGAGPGTAFQKITDAIIAIVGSGVPGNVLVAEGTYVEQLAVLGDIHFYGGYATGFAERVQGQAPSVVRPAAGGTVALRVLASALPTFVDGLDIAGSGAVSNGVDVRNADLQLSNCSIFGLTAEGITGNSRQRVSLLRMHRVLVTGCDREGVQLNGSYRAELVSSQYSDNGTEGMEFDDLTVQKKGLTRLWVRDCVFDGNGDDGLDVDFEELDPLVGGSSREGIIEVLIERSQFLNNQEKGLLLDVDFQDNDKIDVDAMVWDCLVSRNTLEGILVDGDAAALFVFQGNETSANRRRDFSLTSDGGVATLLLTNHWGRGAGLEGFGVTGPGHAYLSHVGVTGSFLNTVTGNGSTVLVNGALWLADPPAGAEVSYTYSDTPIPGPGNFTGLPEVNVAPFDSFFLTRQGTRSSFTLPAGASVDPGDTVELDDDGMARTILAVNGDVAQFDPPTATALPAFTHVGRFADTDVKEDPRLVPGSTWVDAGDPIEQDPDASVTDVGILGGELMSFAPEWAGAWRPFVVAAFSPGPGTATGAVAQVDLGLTEAADPATLNATSMVVLLDGSPVSGSRTTSSRGVRFIPDVPLQGGTVEIQLHRTLASLKGAPLALPVRYQVVVP